jgi:hypothetical protein
MGRRSRSYSLGRCSLPNPSSRFELVRLGSDGEEHQSSSEQLADLSPPETSAVRSKPYGASTFLIELEHDFERSATPGNPGLALCRDDVMFRAPRRTGSHPARRVRTARRCRGSSAGGVRLRGSAGGGVTFWTSSTARQAWHRTLSSCTRSSTSPASRPELAKGTLAWASVPEREKEEVLAAFAAHKGEVTSQ